MTVWTGVTDDDLTEEAEEIATALLAAAQEAGAGQVSGVARDRNGDPLRIISVAKVHADAAGTTWVAIEVDSATGDVVVAKTLVEAGAEGGDR